MSMSDVLRPSPAKTDTSPVSVSNPELEKLVDQVGDDGRNKLEQIKLGIRGLEGGDAVDRLSTDLVQKLDSGEISPEDYNTLRELVVSEVSITGSTATSIFARAEQKSPNVMKMLYETSPKQPLVDAKVALEQVVLVATDMMKTGDTSRDRLQTSIDAYKNAAKLAGITDQNEIKQRIIKAIEATGLKINTSQRVSQDNQPISGEQKTPSEQISLSEKYDKHEGVIRTRKKLESYFSGQVQGLGGKIDMDEESSWPSIKKILYDMLTTRDSYYTLLDQFPNAAAMLQSAEALKKNAEYTQDLLQVEAALPTQAGFSQDSNPGWWGMNTNKDVAPINTESSKVYATIATENADFVTHLPDLARQLQTISQRTGDTIKVKVPRTYGSFLQLQDSLVIHFKKPENTNAIQSTIDQWIQNNNIARENRALGRTSVAKDSQDASFSDNVARQAMEEARERFKRLPPDQKNNVVSASELADFSINRAIELSQQKAA